MNPADQRQGITVVMMARPPIPGRCKTRLAKAIGTAAATRLYEAMLLDSLERFPLGLGAHRYVVLATPEDDGPRLMRALAPAPWEVHAQHGGDLGERLREALRRFGDRGEAVVFVGSDSPTLPVATVGAAIEARCGAAQAVVGPTEDGGYYLIALTLEEEGLLREIPWSTDRVYAATRALCASLGVALHELPAGYDVDDDRGLARLRAELQEHPERAPRCAVIVRETS